MKPYRIKKSDIDKKGRGLYATKDIKKGTKIIDYVGKLITKKQTEESDKYDNGKPIYLFTINKRYDLDGDFSWNTAGLINHSCDNNCDYDGKGLKIWVKAIRDIKKGEEFTCDYGFGYDENYKQFPCKCKSKNCCGYIIKAESRWRINKKFAMSNKKKLKEFKPEFLLFSAGFDAHIDDPLAQLRLSSEDFYHITKRTLEVSKSICSGNVVSILEGGYDLRALQDSTKRHVDALIEFN